MKVILLKDVPKLGRKHDVKDVPQGHALNFLIPQKLVVAATPGALLRIKQQQNAKETHKAMADELIKETFRSIHGKTVVLTEKANEQGHLFSKVTTDHIVAAAKQSVQITLDPHWVSVATPIKSTGQHAITLTHGAHKATFALDVQAGK
jgi:large subunit ribosomal protein L9